MARGASLFLSSFLPASMKRALLASGDDTHEESASVRSNKHGTTPLTAIDRTNLIIAPIVIRVTRLPATMSAQHDSNGSKDDCQVECQGKIFQITSEEH